MKRSKRIVLTLLIIVLAFLGVSLFMAMRDISRQAVKFEQHVIYPDAEAYCPGDVMTYDVAVSVAEVPVLLTITETWCEKGLTGRCSAALSRSWNQAVLEPRQVASKAQRRIPADPFFLPGGTYQLYHLAKNGKPDWYIVDDIKIGDSCP